MKQTYKNIRHTTKVTRVQRLDNICHLTNAFTLIEILVVLVIVAIILTVAIMAFGDFGQSRKQHLAVLQLEQTMLAAQAQAILQPAVLGLAFSKTGYTYSRYWLNPKTHKPEWIALHNDVFSQPHAFPTATSIKLSHVKSITKAANTPLIDFLPNGTITRFNVTIAFADKRIFNVSSDGAGGVNVKQE
jgi:general secretion pathway protein H